MNYSDIPQFTRHAGYCVDVSWNYLMSSWLPDQLAAGLNLDPDFQRAHVWTQNQQRRYIEFVLRGGRTGVDIQTNNPGWHNHSAEGPYELVDGKQRIEAVRSFMTDNLRIFPEYAPETGGLLSSQFTGYMRHYAAFKWHVNDLATRAEVLQWYIDLNAGGVVHSEEEIRRVQILLDLEKAHGTQR